MQYTTAMIDSRIIHIPDGEMEQALWYRKEHLVGCRSEVSAFRRKGGIKALLPRHAGDRFFVTIDLVHAFHQVAREMVASVFGFVSNAYFDICFVEMAGQMVLPEGALTSSYLFEKFMSLAIDQSLIQWQADYNGHVSRHADNILATWRKNTGAEFRALLEIFSGLEIRVTPQKPRKWDKDTHIRFCGLVVPRGGQARLSKRKRREILARAEGGSTRSIDGAIEFVNNNR